MSRRGYPAQLVLLTANASRLFVTVNHLQPPQPIQPGEETKATVQLKKQLWLVDVGAPIVAAVARHVDAQFLKLRTDRRDVAEDDPAMYRPDQMGGVGVDLNLKSFEIATSPDLSLAD